MQDKVRTLQWRHNERDGFSNHQTHDCLLICLVWRRSKKTSKPRVTGLCAGNSQATDEFPLQMPSDAENVSIWWRRHEYMILDWDEKHTRIDKYLKVVLFLKSAFV